MREWRVGESVLDETWNHHNVCLPFGPFDRSSIPRSGYRQPLSFPFSAEYLGTSVKVRGKGERGKNKKIEERRIV